MKRRTLYLVVAAGAVVVAIGTGAGVAVAAGGDSEAPITGDALRTASAAALAHTGGGTVTETEVGDEESLYEVEVRRTDGTSVDVQLDKDFKVVGSEADDDTSGDKD